MHHLSLTEAKTVELTSLTDGDVFIYNASDGHDHRTGLVFSKRGVLFLSGPDQFFAVQRESFRTPVVACPAWRNLVLRVPPASETTNWESVKAGRVVVDERGPHLVFGWRNA